MAPRQTIVTIAKINTTWKRILLSELYGTASVLHLFLLCLSIFCKNMKLSRISGQKDSHRDVIGEVTGSRQPCARPNLRTEKRSGRPFPILLPVYDGSQILITFARRLFYQFTKRLRIMTKKWICTVCGYVHEGDEAPEFCPQCKQPKEKFKELVESEGALSFADEHVLGVAKGVAPEILEGLNAHFMGECTEVGMYLAMSRQADREGYPEVAEAFKRYAWEEAEHAAKFAELLGDVVWDTKTNLKKTHGGGSRCMRRQKTHRHTRQTAESGCHPRHCP